jgi:hypothetical protein
MTMRDVTKDRILGALGLTPKPSPVSEVLGVAGIFALGVVVGAALGLLAAPKPGRELREDLRHRLGRAAERAREEAEELHQ